MRKEFKIIAAAAASLAALVLFIYIFNILARPSSMLAYLPEPPDLKPYALVETKDGSFPSRLSAFLTDGPFALFHKDTSRNVLISLAPAARDVSMLVVEEGLGYAEVYAAYRVSAKEAAKLGKGEVPEEWKSLLPAAKAEKWAKDTWKIWSPEVDAPIFYYTQKSVVVMAADEKSFAALVGRRDAKHSYKRFWRQEKTWPGHIEFGDGAFLLDGVAPVKIQFAWRNLPRGRAAGPAGEAKWTISGIKASHKAALMMSVRPAEWKTSERVIPASPVLVAGLNIPKLKGSRDDWPFPLSTAGSLAGLLGLRENSIREVMSGKTVFSLGGKNKLLWFTVPGLMIEFSGKEQVMRELVESFWNNFFLDSEPEKIDGWDYGGSINTPFSVVGVGRRESALLGLIAAESLADGEWLSRYMPEHEKAIGWVVADLPRLGESLSEMTKISSLLTFEDGDDSYEDEEEENGAFFGSRELDQGITDSFGKLLKNMGKVLVVWEQPESGRLEWHR